MEKSDNQWFLFTLYTLYSNFQQSLSLVTFLKFKYEFFKRNRSRYNIIYDCVVKCVLVSLKKIEEFHLNKAVYYRANRRKPDPADYVQIVSGCYTLQSRKIQRYFLHVQNVNAHVDNIRLAKGILTVILKCSIDLCCSINQIYTEHAQHYRIRQLNECV